MEARLALTPIWEPVYTLPQGTDLGTVAAPLLAQAAKIPDRYLCYAWTSEPTIHYIGSVTRDWQAGHGTRNLRGRVQAYLGSARPTNARVRGLLAATLPTQAITLSVLRFAALHFGDTSIDRATFATHSALVLAVEALLIASYRQIGQCPWNLTGGAPEGVQKGPS